jgi:membrane associated rhomboid family serine protease
VTTFILIITCAISFLAFQSSDLKSKMLFNAYQIHHRKEWYRFFSSGLIHQDWAHLAFNMFSLWMFGFEVERGYKDVFDEKGTLFFVLLYVGGLAMSSLYSYEKNKNNIYYNALGASGAVSSVVFAFIILAPTTKLEFLFVPVPIPAYLFGILFLAIEYYLGKRGGTNIGHDAHFWGAVYGAVLTVILKPALLNDFIDQIRGN